MAVDTSNLVTDLAVRLRLTRAWPDSNPPAWVGRGRRRNTLSHAGQHQLGRLRRGPARPAPMQVASLVFDA